MNGHFIHVLAKVVIQGRDILHIEHYRSFHDAAALFTCGSITRSLPKHAPGKEICRRNGIQVP